MRFFSFRGKSGYTLIELLIVISIIGILVGLATVSFSSIQRKSRDAKRRGDIKAMQTAFEQYYLRNGAFAACNTMNVAFPGGLPVDPSSGAQYTCTGTAATYCACAFLENGGGNSSNGSCTYVPSTSAIQYYCLSNLQ